MQMSIAVPDEIFMQRALDLAASTAGLSSPNPQVGCVLVRDGTVIGEGGHLYERRDHAEVAALKDAAERGFRVEGGTAYVTLEPCSHHGRTGPCADALIAAKVARVVVGTVDPNPQVSGSGIARLQDAGVAVTTGVCELEARTLVEAFARFIRHRTPLVTLKAALSADGKLAPPPAQRLQDQPFWLTGSAARGEVQRLRHAADAVLTGIGTVLADDPLLTDRTDLPRNRPILRVVLDTHLRLPLGSKLVQSAGKRDLLIFCGASAHLDRRVALGKAGVEVETVPAHDSHLSLPAVLATLAQRDVLSLLLECGSHLNGAFLNHHLVDKVVLFFAQTELGEDAIPFAHGAPSPFLLEPLLTRITRTSFGPDACLSGYLRDPWLELDRSPGRNRLI